MSKPPQTDMPRGYAFGGERAQRVERHLGLLTAENAKRVPCPHCPLQILPAGLERHIDVCHGDGE